MAGRGGVKPDIWQAVKTGNIEAVKKNLLAGTDVNANSKPIETPLHYVAFWMKDKWVLDIPIKKTGIKFFRVREFQEFRIETLNKCQTVKLINYKQKG